MRPPLNVIVTWIDACTRSVTVTWDGTAEATRKIAEEAPLYTNRKTSGFIVAVNEDALWLAHDYDEDEKQAGNLTVIPLGWVTRVTSARGTILFAREAASKPKKAKAPLHNQE